MIAKKTFLSQISYREMIQQKFRFQQPFYQKGLINTNLEHLQTSHGSLITAFLQNYTPNLLIVLWLDLFNCKRNYFYAPICSYWSRL